ncbi:Exocyst complex component 3 [Bienertia sinuspersici]
MMSNGSRQQSGNCLRYCLLGFAIALTLSIFGPALYWKVNKGTKLGQYHKSSCSPCLANLSTEDLQNEMEKQYAELLMEELKLQEVVAQEQIRHMNATYREARRVASQYQREAEKCTIAIETCEEARERAEALIRREMKLAFLWEQRAHKMGWEAE